MKELITGSFVQLAGPDKKKYADATPDKQIYCISTSNLPKKGITLILNTSPPPLPHELFNCFPVKLAIRTKMPNDCFIVQQHQNSLILALGSGCPGSTRDSYASHVACQHFTEYMKSKLVRITSFKEAGYYLLRAFLYCHSQILEHSEESHEPQENDFEEDEAPKKEEPRRDIYAAGTTSLLGGVIAELNEVRRDLKEEDIT